MGVRLQASILHLGRNCDGENKRLQAWIQLLQALEVDVKLVPLLHRHRRSWLKRSTPSRGQRPYVPEGKLWSISSLMNELQTDKPDIVVGVTSRCWHQRLNDGNWKLVLDFVDTLSTNYRIRSAMSNAPKKVLFEYLAHTHTKAEKASSQEFPNATFVYAGFSEAVKQGAHWIPNLVTVPSEPQISEISPVEPVHDLVFFGALYTPINVDAVRALAASSTLNGRRVLLAGRRPSAYVARVARQKFWNLAVDFPSAAWLAKQAKVSVVPLGPSTGMQNKVLDAAAVGMPQSVTQTVLNGFEPGFPLRGSSGQNEAIDHGIELAGCDPVIRYRVAQRTQEYVVDNYTPRRWAPVLAELIGIDQPKVKTGRFPLFSAVNYQTTGPALSWQGNSTEDLIKKSPSISRPVPKG